MIVLGERHLHRIVTEYLDYYHNSRCHLSLNRNSSTPVRRNQLIEARLSRSLGFVGWIAAAGNLLFVLSLEGMYEGFGLSLATYQALLWSRAFLHLVIWICAIRVLWRFVSMISPAAEVRCINCGYSLEGLTSLRCPECGLGHGTRGNSTRDPGEDIGGQSAFSQ